MNTKEFISYIQTKSDTVKLEILRNNEFSTYNALNIMKSMTDEGKRVILSDSELKEKYSLAEYNLCEIITSMNEQEVDKLLKNKEKIIQVFGDQYPYYVSKIILSLQDEDKRFAVAEDYKLGRSEIARITQECSDERKQEILLSKKYKFRKNEIIKILSKFEVPNLLQFIQENKEIVQENEIKIHEVVKFLSTDKQFELVSQVENIDLNLEDKLKAMVALKPIVKDQIDRNLLSSEYIKALNMPLINPDNAFAKDSGFINIDLDGDLTIYKGYDELIRIRPQDIPLDKHDKLIELAKICPNLEICDNLNLTSSTAQEFLNGEKWISDVVSHIQDEWTDIQKIAYIDYRIGKKISYSPDYDTEVAKEASARALWRIIDSEYGVCNGISQVEQYLLKHVGIESEIVNSESHSFLKIKDIEIPRVDGTSVKGETIVDPTWNLTPNRYGAYPNLFARSYSEIRKFDITKDGKDRECHKNDEKLASATINIEEKVLREVYKSLGLAKEDGKFPFSDTIEKSNEIASKNISIEQKIEEQLELLKRMHPDFYKCQNPTISILAGNILNHDEMDFRKLVVNRVYDKSDEDKRPLVYVYCNIDGKKEVFFAVDSESKSFLKYDKETFTQKYECYEYDMEKDQGLRPWEKGVKEVEEDLTRSSGKIISQEQLEGDER